MHICKSFFIKVIKSQYLLILWVFLFIVFYFTNNVFAYTIPQITNMNFSPNLNISRFSDYTINVITSGTFVSGSIDLTRINGDWGNCKQYYASGTCFSSGSSTYPLTYIGSNIRQETWVRPDDLYPQIFFAPNEMVRNTTHSSNIVSLNNYEILHLQNPFTMESGMSFFIELNVAPVSTGNSLDLNVYLV